MLAKTRQTNEKMLRKREATYVTPETLSRNIQSNVREQKERDAELRARLAVEVRNELPGATEEALNAIVTRKMYELEQQKNEPEDKELTLRPDLKKTIRRETVVERYHSGKYEVNKFSKKGKKAWSCCMAKEEDAPGCVVRKVDKHKWNVEGY